MNNRHQEISPRKKKIKTNNKKPNVSKECTRILEQRHKYTNIQERDEKPITQTKYKD